MTVDVDNIPLQTLTLCANVQSSNRILKTGVNTLQRTLVLKTQVQLDDVNSQLTQKRLEFKDRMQALEQRRATFLQKQEEVSCQGAKEMLAISYFDAPICLVYLMTLLMSQCKSVNYQWHLSFLNFSSQKHLKTYIS